METRQGPYTQRMLAVAESHPHLFRQDQSTWDGNEDSDEITSAIAPLNPSSSVGPDGIPLPALIAIGNTLTSPLCKIFTAILELGHFPEPWKVSRVTVIAKPNKPSYTSLSSFRPISVVNSFARIFEKVVLGRLTWLSKKHDWFSNN